MHSHRLFITGLALLLFLFISGCGGSSTGTPGSGGATAASANPLIVDSTLSTLKIEADIPPMEVNHQVVVAVSIFPTGGHKAVSQVQVVKNATAIITNATPVGTPGTTLVNAFGPNHTVDATATLYTSPVVFSVAPTGPRTKPLDQERVEWDWFVTPLVAGPQTIGVEIVAQWTSTLSGKQSLPYTLGYPQFPVTVQALPVVPTPTPTPPPPQPPDFLAILNAILPPLATIVAAIITAIAALFAIPGFRRWVRVRFRGAKERPPAEPRAPTS